MDCLHDTSVLLTLYEVNSCGNYINYNLSKTEWCCQLKNEKSIDIAWSTLGKATLTIPHHFTMRVITYTFSSDHVYWRVNLVGTLETPAYQAVKIIIPCIAPIDQKVVSLTFCELSKIISQKYTMPEITFLVRISSWNFVHVPKAWLWAHE